MKIQVESHDRVGGVAAVGALTLQVLQSSWQRTHLLFILAKLAQMLKRHHGGHAGQVPREYLQHRRLSFQQKKAFFKTNNATKIRANGGN